MKDPGTACADGGGAPSGIDFDALYDRHKDFVFKYSFYLARDRSEAEELFQETWLRVVRNPSGIKTPPERLRPWLCAIVSNLFKDSLRRKRTRRRFLEARIPDGAGPEGGGAVEAASPGPGPEKAAENARLAGRLRKAVDGLPERQRRVFLLREVEGLSLEETAGALGIPLGTVKSLGFRAVRSLRSALAEYSHMQRKSPCDVGIVKAF